MKKTNMLLFIAALLVAGCVKEQPKNEEKEYSRANFDTVYNEIVTVMDMYGDTAVANDYLCEQIKKLSSDVFEVVATDSDFAHNIYLRAFSRAFFATVSQDSRPIPVKCCEKLIWSQNVFTTFSYGTWDYMTTTMMPSWQEYENRNVYLSIMKSTDGTEGLVATFTNYTDTVIKNPTIVFEGNGRVLLELNSKNTTIDDSESGSGVVRMIVNSLDEVLEVLKQSQFILAFYDTPKERVMTEQMVLFLDYQRKYNNQVRNIFGE